MYVMLCSLKDDLQNPATTYAWVFTLQWTLLTALGGGAFGNKTEWIADAIESSLAAHAMAPLDVTLVHYSSRIMPEFARIQQGNKKD